MNKNLKIVITSILLLIFLVIDLYSQGTKYCQMLGKTFKDVRKVYGAPTFENHDDKSIQWIFYKLDNNQITFVSDDKNVFQVQVEISCASEKDSQKKIDVFFKECGVNEMKVDTIKDGSFKIKGRGISVDLFLLKNTSRDSYGFKYKAVIDTTTTK